MPNLRTMHLFAGIGGGLLADLILGHEPIIAVEWDAYACQVLRERAADGWFPSLRVWEGDVRLFDPSEYAGQVDCIHSGFPCQDISVAGNQAGVGKETRSGLYREVLRIAGVVRPRFIYLENVAAIVTNGLGTVLDDLAALRYDSEWLCLRASDCGAAHHRDRWWLLARARHSRVCQRRKPVNACEPLREQRGNGCDGISCCEIEEGEILAYSDSTQREGSERAKRIRKEYANTCGGGWGEVESAVGRVANGIPNRIHRLKGLGNAQVPIQAAVAWKLLGGQ